MKKYIYTVTLILMAITVTQAQRMLPKQKGLEISTGVLSDDKIGNDYYISAAMTVNGKMATTSFGRWNTHISTTIIKPFAYRRKLILPRAVTASSCWAMPVKHYAELRNNRCSRLRNHQPGRNDVVWRSKILSEDNFIYGAGGRLTFETYLSDRFVLVLQGRTKVLWGTDLQRFRPSAGVGLRFNF